MTAPTPDGGARSTQAAGARDRAVVAAELAALRRHALDVPPHGGGAARSELAERIASLEAELARLERVRPERRSDHGGRGR